jgi:hypothetical protein
MSTRSFVLNAVIVRVDMELVLHTKLNEQTAIQARERCFLFEDYCRGESVPLKVSKDSQMQYTDAHSVVVVQKYAKQIFHL